MAVREIPIQEAVAIAKAAVSNIDEKELQTFLNAVAAVDANRLDKIYRSTFSSGEQHGRSHCTKLLGESKKMREDVSKMRGMISLDDLAVAKEIESTIDETARQTIIGALKAAAGTSEAYVAPAFLRYSEPHPIR